MLDAGTGVSNLSLVSDVLARHDHLSVILSHYHLDHTVGLMYLKRFCADKRLDVYGPGRPVYRRTTEQIVSSLLDRDIYSSGPYGFAREVHYHDYGGRDFSCGSCRIGVCAQDHSSPSFLLRLQDKVLYCTDTTLDAERVALFAPARLLLHECWQADDADPRHSSIQALSTRLPAHLFDRILLIHHNPAWSADDMERVARAAAGFGAELAADGMCVEL